MSRVPSRPCQWEACPLQPGQRLRTFAVQHPPTCLGQLGNREQFVSGDSRFQEVPLGVQVVLGGRHCAERKAYDESGAGDRCRQDCVQRPCRSHLEASGAAVWDGAGSKCTDTRLRGGRCQLLTSYKSTFAH